MVSRETILVYVKKYQKPLLILALAWMFTVGAIIITMATLLMSDQTPISVQQTRATDYAFNWPQWSEWRDEVITGVRGRNYYG